MTTQSLAVADRNATATSCTHCGEPCTPGATFCCTGCEAAHAAITGMGLDDYYQRRLLDPSQRGPRPDLGVTDTATRFDLASCVRPLPEGRCELILTVDGVQCGACVWLIEQVLAREPGIETARVNMTSLRLRLVWKGEPTRADTLVATVERLGYRLVPFNAAGRDETDRTGRALIRALAVAGFAAGNVMLLSIGIWAGLTEGMGPATRTLLHWVSALISMPAIAYAGQPFFRSAIHALRHRRTNMDVPISVGVLLVTVMSLSETISGGTHTYFDSAVTLLFFLLIGRVLDHRARGLARANAERLLSLRQGDVSLINKDGTISRSTARAVAQGQCVLAGMGERIGVDGIIVSGTSLLDTSLVTGESLPEQVRPGAAVFAGTVNLGNPLTIRATATGEGTLLAEMARLIDAAEARRGRFVVLADRVARAYAPCVHLAALATLLVWVFALGAPTGEALLIACAVLIITCPCALALAVPAAQVIAAGSLFRAGTLLKSGTALERLAAIDTVVFDKTGTLSEPELALIDTTDREALALAATLAATSRHPLTRALALAAGPTAPAADVIEHQGRGLSRLTPEGEIRLGSAEFTGAQILAAAGAELWLSRPNHAPTRFSFAETLRPDAAATIRRLTAMGLTVHLLSGDREAPVHQAAGTLGIAAWKAGCKPAAKVAEIEALQASGHRVLMVGDGLNDGPCLAAASVSMSPATAADISQTIADLVFQGRNLAPVADAIAAARRTQRIMRENIALAIGYNVIAVPFAAAGYVTPWLAAAAMSLSSLLVMANSLRLRSTQ